MKTDQYSYDPMVIEADLARDRAALAASFHNLRTTVSTDHLLDEASAFARSKVGPLVQTVDTAVRANPVAAGLALAGIAWLIFGGKSTRESQSKETLQDAIGRWEDEGGPAIAEDTKWLAETDHVQSRAKAALADLEHAARARLRPAADIARERIAIVADVAASTRATMARGLESLSDATRNQIISARERAYAARAAFASKGTAMIEDHPFVTGAIALAAGAAVAVRLPVTAIEHRILGPERDRLFADMQNLLQAEHTHPVSETHTK